MRPAPVNHRESVRGQLRKQPRLRVCVVVHVAVIVQMIAGEIGKHRGVKGQRGRAALLQRVAGNFHDRCLASVMDHLCQQA